MLAFVRFIRRRQVVIVLVLAALLAASFACNLTGCKWASRSESESIVDYARATKAECEAYAREFIVSDFTGKHPAAKSAEPQPEQQKQNDLYGFCLNALSVKAARDSADYSRGQYRTSILTALIAGLALLAAGAAARFAHQSVREARRSANEAHRQANVAEDAYRNLERPIVLIEIARTSLQPPGDQPPFIKYRLVNAGRAAAILRSVSVGFCDHDEVPETTLEPVDQRYVVLPAGAVGHDIPTVTLKDHGEEKRGVRYVGASVQRLNIRVALEYADATGTIYVVFYRLRGQPDPGGFRLEWYVAQPPFQAGRDGGVELGRMT